MRYFIYIFLAFFIIGCSSKPQSLTIISEENKNGVINNENVIQIKPIYDNISNFENVNTNYTHPNYFNLHWLHNSNKTRFAKIEQHGKIGIINEFGKPILNPVYDSISDFFNGYAVIEYQHKFGLINEDFKIVLKPIFGYVSPFNFNKISFFKYQDSYGCINEDIKIILAPKFDFIHQFKKGFARVEKNGKWGIIDEKCHLLVKPIYDYIYDFDNESFKFKRGNNFGFLNAKGKVILNPILSR